MRIRLSLIVDGAREFSESQSRGCGNIAHDGGSLGRGRQKFELPGHISISCFCDNLEMRLQVTFFGDNSDQSIPFCWKNSIEQLEIQLCLFTTRSIGEGNRKTYLELRHPRVSIIS